MALDKWNSVLQGSEVAARPNLMHRPPTFVVALAVPVIALVAVIGTRVIEGPSSSGTDARAGANAVVIKNFAFAPSKLSVADGATLKVTNDDGTTHTFTARDGDFDTGDLGGGKTATITLKKTGTFNFFCQIHNFMTGTLVVT
jgi:plastocyanin